MVTKWFFYTVTVMLILGVTQLGLAQPECKTDPGFGDGPGFGHRRGLCQDREFGRGDGPNILTKAEALELTSEQIKKIKAMRLDMAKEKIRLRSELDLKELELRELMSADEPDIRRIEAKIDEMAPLRTELQKKRIGHRLAVRDVLTLEQREKLELMRGPGMRHHSGSRDGHRGSLRW
ncbi:MAG: Spy/CpxP family protein refolding chaperone [Gemmatimonadota bacterium]|nr:MAG: Spy/CpxP family protein refolding chaperone [Gemmatimonadota bacterium]